MDREEEGKVVDQKCYNCGHYSSQHLYNDEQCQECTKLDVDPCYHFSVKKIDPLKTLEEDRGKIYGDPFLSHQAIGLVWEGIFRNRYHGKNFITVFPVEVGKLFPADLVAELLAGFKITRLARPTYHKDSADDAKVYIDFSMRFRDGR